MHAGYTGFNNYLLRQLNRSQPPDLIGWFFMLQNVTHWEDGIDFWAGGYVQTAAIHGVNRRQTAVRYLPEMLPEEPLTGQIGQVEVTNSTYVKFHPKQTCLSYNRLSVLGRNQQNYV